MRDVRKTGGYLKRFGMGIILSVLLMLMVSTGWAAPTVTDMQPPEGSTQPVSTTASVTFSEAMDPATITNGSFTVSRFVGIKAVAIGTEHTLALRGDGTVIAWGQNGSGQATVPTGLSGVTAIAAGDMHSVALKSDGTVVAWGYNYNGLSTIPMGLAGVTAIAASDRCTVVLKDDGTVIGWGDNQYGECTAPIGLSGVTAIVAGAYHLVALKNDGTVVAWGDNQSGQTSVPADLVGVSAIAAGDGFTLALKDDGTVVAWGQSIVPAGLFGVQAIAAGRQHSAALKNDGTVIAWGGNLYGQTTVPTDLSGATAIYAGGFQTVAVKEDGTAVIWGHNSGKEASLSGIAAVAGGYHSLALKGDGTVVAWGWNSNGQTTVPADLSRVTAIAVGDYHSVALKDDGTVVAWGMNYASVPAGLVGVTAIAAGGGYTVALKSDGSVVAWGNNGYNQCTVPAGLSGVTAIAAGAYHSVALKDDGTVVAWGANFAGQTAVPVGLTGVVAVAAGVQHSVALKGDGTVVAWGANYFGQSTVPANLTGVTAIAAGEQHTVALKGDGTVTAWGRNDYYGQTTIPTGLSGVTAIAAGYYQTLALKDDGTVVSWGQNSGANAIIWESPVAGTVSYDQMTKAILTPTAPLEPLSIYFVTVNTSARNTFGDHLVADARWSFTTDKAPAAITLDGLNQIYDGNPLAVTATTEPAGLIVDITYNGSPTVPTNAGSYVVVATISDPRYQGSASGTLVIDKANAQIDFVGLNPTYDGASKIVTATTIPAGLSVDLTYYAGATNAGSYPVDAIITDANYQGSAFVTLEIAKATATVNLSGLSQTYDATAKIVTATTIPAGLNVDIFYDNSATNAGSYPVDAMITDVNYQGSVSGTLVIAKAAATVTLSDLNQTYTGTPIAAVATTNPVGLVVNFTYNGSTTVPKNVGNYEVVGTINDLNFEGSSTGTLVITKADQTISFTCPATANLADRINLKATADSKLPVTLTVTSGPGVINGSKLTFTGTGTVVVTASQAGDNNYNPAADVQTTINVL